MKLRWKWILAAAGAVCLALAFFSAKWSFEVKDQARRRAGEHLVAANDAVARIVRDLVTDAAAKLRATQPGQPVPAPLESVGRGDPGTGPLESETIPVPELRIWIRFGKERIRIWEQTAPAQFVQGTVLIDELRRRLAADPAIGEPAAKRWNRLALADHDGEIVFQRQLAVTDKRKKDDRAAGRVTTGQRQIAAKTLPKPDDDGLPEDYRDADDKLVRASWRPVFEASQGLWVITEVRDAEVVAGMGGWHLEILGYEVGEAMPWHFALGLGLLLLIASAFFWLPARGGTEVGVLLRTYQFAKPYAWGIVFAVGVGAIYGGSRAYRAFIAKNLVNDVLVDPGTDHDAAFRAIWKIVWATLALGLITAISNYFKEYLQNYYSTAMMADVRVALARKIVSLPLSFFNRIRSGDLVARIERDVAGMRQVLLQVFDKAFVAPFLMVAAIVSAFVMNWALALVLFGLPLLVIPVFKIARKIKKRATKRQNLLADISHVLFQMLTGIKVVKAFHGETREADRLDQANRRFIHEARRIARLSAFSDSLLDFLQMVGGAIVVGAGGYGVVRGKVEVGDLVGFVVVIISVYDAAKDITSVLNKLIESLPAVERVYEIFDTQSDLVDGTKDVPAGPLQQGIVLEGVRFKYLENDILKGVDLTIPAGQVVAIVGPTGAGKTTLCDLVARFYDPTEGRVLWDGVDARDYRVKSLVSRLAIVTQDAFLFNAPIDENIRYGREDATKEEVEQAAKDANVHDEILQMEGGYTKMAGERGTSLSGGQRQRVTIARALIKDAPVLILDEATSNLDTHSEKRVQEALARLMHGRTVLVVAHRLSTIRSADKVVVVDGGRIVEQGAPADLLRLPNGRFRQMWDQQTGGDAAAGA